MNKDNLARTAQILTIVTCIAILACIGAWFFSHHETQTQANDIAASAWKVEAYAQALKFMEEENYSLKNVSSLAAAVFEKKDNDYWVTVEGVGINKYNEPTRKKVQVSMFLMDGKFEKRGVRAY